MFNFVKGCWTYNFIFVWNYINLKILTFYSDVQFQNSAVKDFLVPLNLSAITDTPIRILLLIVLVSGEIKKNYW